MNAIDHNRAACGAEKMRKLPAIISDTRVILGKYRLVPLGSLITLNLRFGRTFRFDLRN